MHTIYIFILKKFVSCSELGMSPESLKLKDPSKISLDRYLDTKQN